jgi:hypothetical protein
MSTTSNLAYWINVTNTENGGSATPITKFKFINFKRGWKHSLLFNNRHQN